MSWLDSLLGSIQSAIGGAANDVVHGGEKLLGINQPQAPQAPQAPQVSQPQQQAPQVGAPQLGQITGAINQATGFYPSIQQQLQQQGAQPNPTPPAQPQGPKFTDLINAIAHPAEQFANAAVVQPALGLAKGAGQIAMIGPNDVRALTGLATGNKAAAQNAMNQASQGVKQAEGFAQFLPRAATQVGLSAADILNPSKQGIVYNPSNPVTKAVLGEQPVQSFRNILNTTPGSLATKLGTQAGQAAGDVLGLEGGIKSVGNWLKPAGTPPAPVYETAPGAPAESALSKEIGQIPGHQADVQGLSEAASNSLQNSTNGIKPGALERATQEIQRGDAPPVTVKIEDAAGNATIIDGRHHLEAARQLGIQNYPIEVVDSPMAKKMGITVGDGIKPLTSSPVYETAPTATSPAQEEFNQTMDAENPNRAKTPEIGQVKPGEAVDESQFKPVANLKDKFAPIKGLPADVQKDFGDWVNARRTASLEGLRTNLQMRDVPGGTEAIDAFQRGERTPQTMKVEQYFQNKLAELNSKGVNTGNYGKDYLPGEYTQNGDQAAAIGKRLGLKPGFSLEKEFPTQAAAREAGFTPRFENMSDMMQSYEARANKSIADRQFFNSQIEKGTILPASQAPASWKTLDPDHFPINSLEPYKAPAAYAKILNDYLSDTGGNLYDRGLAKTKRIVLGAGVPGTGLNMHGVNEAARAYFAGGVRGGAGALLDEASPSIAQAHFHANIDDAVRFSKAGANTDVEGAHIAGADQLDKATGGVIRKILGKASDLQENLYEKPGFGKSFPDMQLRFMQNFEKTLLDKGTDPAVAERQAALMGNRVFSGTNIEELGRDPKFQRNLSRAFLAPKFFGTNWELAKTLTQIGSSEAGGVLARRIAGNLTTSYVTLNLLNKQLSGHWMYQNAPGQEFALDTGGKDSAGKDRFISVFGTAADFIRLPTEAALGIVKGDPTVITSMLRNRLSTVMGAGLSLLANIDYKQDPIFGNDKNGVPQTLAQQALGVGKVIAGATSPAPVNAALNYLSSKASPPGTATQESPEEVVANALGSNLRYKKNIDPTTQAYFNGINKAQSTLTNAADIKDFKDYLSRQKTFDGKTIQESPSDRVKNSQLLFGNDNLRNAIQQANQSQSNHDPMWDLSSDKLKTFIEYEKQYSGDADKTALANQNPWISDVVKQRSDYYNKLQISGSSVPNPQGVPYPNFPQGTKDALTIYNGLSDTSQKATFLQDHPEVLDAFGQIANYTNKMRAAEGAPQLAKAPQADAKTQAIMNYYNTLPKNTGARSSWIKANPTAYADMTNFLTQNSVYEAAKNVAQAQFEGGTLNQKALKAISNLGQYDITKNADGTYALNAGGAKGGSGGSKTSTRRARIVLPQVKTYPRTIYASKPKQIKLKVKVPYTKIKIKPIKTGQYSGGQMPKKSGII